MIDIFIASGVFMVLTHQCLFMTIFSFLEQKILTRILQHCKKFNCLLDIAIDSEPVETKTNSFYHELYMIYFLSVTKVHNDDKTHN